MLAHHGHLATSLPPKLQRLSPGSVVAARCTHHDVACRGLLTVLAVPLAARLAALGMFGGAALLVAKRVVRP